MLVEGRLSAYARRCARTRRTQKRPGDNVPHHRGEQQQSFLRLFYLVFLQNSDCRLGLQVFLFLLARMMDDLPDSRL